MFPRIDSEGRLMVPIIPSQIETAPGVWMSIDGMRELKPGEPNYEETFNMLKAKRLRDRCELLEQLPQLSHSVTVT